MLHTIALAVVLHVSNVAGVAASTLGPAKIEVARLYREIGVEIEWSDDGSRGGGERAIRVVLLDRETGALRQRSETVMGAAVRTPGGTSAAYVFVRRVESEAAQFDVPLERVLACAIAHEIGHLLLPGGVTSGHSPDGLMRPCWSRADFHRAEKRLLRFSAGQAALIRAAIAPAPRLATTSDIPGSAETTESCPPPRRLTAAPCR